jgi:replicative DNA helicase
MAADLKAAKGKYAETVAAHDREAERMILACAVHKPELVSVLDDDLFYQSEARRVLAKMKDFVNEQRASIHKAESFEHDLMLALDRMDFALVNGALNDLPSAHNWSYWLDVLKDFRRARALEQIKPEMSKAADGLVQGDSSGLVKVQQRFTEIVRNEAEGQSTNMQQICAEALEDVENSWRNGAIKGLGTGLAPLNRFTQGLQRGYFYVVAARPSQGKTTLVLQIAHWIATEKKKVLFFSLEMNGTDLANRILSNVTRIPLSKFVDQNCSEKDFRDWAKASLDLSKLDWSIVNLSSLSEILLLCEQTRNVDLIVVDYLQRIRVPHFRGNRNELVTEISVGLKDLAMRLEAPVLVAAQLSRASEKEGRLPGLADLRDSGSIEQDADVVAMLHPTKEQTELLIVKNRSGETGRAPLKFHRSIFRFEALL